MKERLGTDEAGIAWTLIGYLLAATVASQATVFVGFGMFGSFLLIPQLAEGPEATGYGFALTATGAGLLMLGAGPLSVGIGFAFAAMPNPLGVLGRWLAAAAEAKVLGEGTVIAANEAALAHARERWLEAIGALLARADGSVFRP